MTVNTVTVKFRSFQDSKHIADEKIIDSDNLTAELAICS